MNESMILASIDNIDACVQESAISILDKLVLEYDKMSQILDAALFDEGVIMEGQVWDTATGKDKNESVFFKALAFLPRLLMGIIKAVASVFTKDYKSENEKNAKLANAQLAKVNDPNQLEMCRNNVATISDGELEFNPKKKQFFLTRGFRHIRNYIRILIGVTPILTKLRLGLNGAKMPYSTLAKDLFAVLKGEKSLDETTSGLTADALLELANDSWSAATGVKGIVDELQMKLSKKMNEDFANGKNVEDQIHAKAILDGITNVAGKVTKVAMFGKIVHFLGKDLGGGSIFMRKIKSKMAFDKEEDVALANAKNEKKAGLFYDYLDNRSELFKGTVEKNSRSLMNIPFVTGDADLDKAFIAECEKAGIVNIKGHRTVGGMRASVYNAMPYEGVVRLIEVMEKFEKEHK